MAVRRRGGTDCPRAGRSAKDLLLTRTLSLVPFPDFRSEYPKLRAREQNLLRSVRSKLENGTVDKAPHAQHLAVSREDISPVALSITIHKDFPVGRYLSLIHLALHDLQVSLMGHGDGRL